MSWGSILPFFAFIANTNHELGPTLLIDPFEGAKWFLTITFRSYL